MIGPLSPLVTNPVIRLDEVENFWGPAGDTGACGPCSEIKFFMGTDEELKRVLKEHAPMLSALDADGSRALVGLLTGLPDNAHQALLQQGARPLSA